MGRERRAVHCLLTVCFLFLSSKTQAKKDVLNYPQQKKKKEIILLNLADVKVKPEKEPEKLSNPPRPCSKLKQSKSVFSSESKNSN